MDPIDLIISAELNYIQGFIITKVYNYKNRFDGLDTINKCIEYAKIAIENDCTGPDIRSINLGYSFCKVENLDSLQTNVIIATMQDDYYNVIRYCKAIIKRESRKAI